VVRLPRDVNETLAYETETRPRPCKAETETFFETFNLQHYAETMNGDVQVKTVLVFNILQCIVSTNRRPILTSDDSNGAESPKHMRLPAYNKSLAVAEQGDRLATIDICRKVGELLYPFQWGGELGSYLTQCRLGRGLPPYQQYQLTC